MGEMGAQGGRGRPTEWGRYRSVYCAFDIFPAPKGSSTHMALMLQALEQALPPVLCLCLGTPAHPRLQVESPFLTIRRWTPPRAHLLERTRGFGRFVESVLASLPAPPELLVFRDPWSGIPAMAALPSTPALFEVNGLPSWELPYAYRALERHGPLLEKLRDMEWSCIQGAQGLITVSPVTRRALVGLGAPRERVAVVPNGALEPFFEAGPPPSLKGRRLLYVGSLQPWQGVETAVEALALLDRRTTLTIIHPGKRRWLKGLKRLARRRGVQERVEFREGLSREEVAREMARSRALLAPLAPVDRNTLQGCCPLKVVEAMAVGVVVAASDLEVCRGLLDPGEEGLLLPPDDPRAWAHGLAELLGRPEEAHRMGLRARERALRRHHPGVIVQELKGLFRRAAQGRWPREDPYAPSE